MMLTVETSSQWLDIPETVHTEAWAQSQTVVGDRWQVYLNQVCLQTILPWLQEKFDREPVVQTPTTPQFWELVNGSAIAVGDTRIILVPTESMDHSELRVPQEWIDIPDWMGDYYLAVEVNPDDQGLDIWGYSTHAQIKAEAEFDASDRAYALTGEGLIQDVTVFWVMQQLATEPTRSTIPALTELPATTTNSLIQQLASSDVIVPRLELPFQQWGALLQSDRALQILCQQRTRPDQPQPITESPQPTVQLGQWLNNLVETSWQTLEMVFGATPDLAFSFRGENAQAPVQRVKLIRFSDELQVVLAIAVETEPDERRRIAIRVLPRPTETVLPAHLQLQMISPSGEVLQSVASSDQSRYIQLRPFKCLPATTFRLNLEVEDVSVTEDFVA